MPESQDEDRGVCDLVAKLVVADDDPPDLAGRKGIELLAYPRIVEKPAGCARKLLHEPRRRIGSDRTQMLVKPNEIGGRLAGSLDHHAEGGGSGLSVPRLSAQACTAW